MKLIYTKHAIIKMYSQGIEAGKVEDTIINGEKKLESKRQDKYRAVKQYGSEKIHVVFRVINGDILKVITCKKLRV
ncbi:MAG: DUF4258 domain-containing protein [Candidatus Aenigmarchaeota archaeon]|nr:DUF4258 domain-containing protein [Candidatus Aenigmarchaeota archaeon]